MSGKIKTGIRKEASFKQNLEAVKASIETHGYFRVVERLEEMKEFWWVEHEDSPACNCLICNLRNCINLADFEPQPEKTHTLPIPRPAYQDAEFSGKW